MTTAGSEVDAIVIGGGPAGAVSAALLAARGYDVRLITQPPDPHHDLANSLPPSTRKLLIATGVLPIVDRVALKSRGNTVWWGADDVRVESFDPSARLFGYQVLRSALDPLLLDHARRAGVALLTDSTVRAVDLQHRQVTFRHAGARSTTMRARLVLDCSGRAGVVARQGFRPNQPDMRMQALLGIWQRPRWVIPDETHTVVETYADGWAWSIPVAPGVRHVGVMIDGALSGVVRGKTLAATYKGELAKASHLNGQVAGAMLHRVWACDASVYSAREFGAQGVLLVGDAGSAIDPLSSFGVKKALASAWLAAIVAHTCLADREREAAALQFFNDWERKVYRTHAERSRAFAREARTRYPTPFWTSRAAAAGGDEAGPDDGEALVRLPAVASALARLRHSSSGRLVRDDRTLFAQKPEVCNGEIAMMDAVAVPGGASVRYFRNIDLVDLAAQVPSYDSVPDLFERYAVPRQLTLPVVLASLSLLVAARILRLEPETT